MTRSINGSVSRRIVRLGLRAVATVAVLAGVAVGLPESSVESTDAVLVKTQEARGLDFGKDVVWILGVGSDARPGEDMTRTRGDALQLIGINTRTGAASAVGVPRDAWVPIPGRGSQRVNAALYFGGPRLLGQTVGNLIGVQPHYVFVTRFPFFEDLVDRIGGITVRNPRPFSDVNLKDDGFRRGRIHLGGYDAMAFSRIRKTLPGGDFDRSANQQIVLRGIQQKIRQKQHAPGFIAKGVLEVMRKTSTDLAPSELFRLAQAIAAVDPQKVTTCVVPGAIGNVGGASVVLPNTATARRYGDAMRKDATIERC